MRMYYSMVDKNKEPFLSSIATSISVSSVLIRFSSSHLDLRISNISKRQRTKAFLQEVPTICLFMITRLKMLKWSKSSRTLSNSQMWYVSMCALYILPVHILPFHSVSIRRLSSTFCLLCSF